MRMVIGFMPKQKTVGACVKKSLITVWRTFSYREGDRTVLPAAADGGDDIRQSVVCKPAVFPALKYKSAETKGITLFTAGEDFIF